MTCRLIKPHADYASDFRQMCLECTTAPKPDYSGWDNDFANYLKSDKLEAFEDKIIAPLLDVKKGPLAQYWNVPTEQFWLIDEQNHFLGFTDIRHELITQNENQGGNIGLFLRPSVRGQGISKNLLRLALAQGTTLGLTKALICCHPNNTPSQKIIESVLQEVGGKALPDGFHKDVMSKRFLLNTIQIQGII